MDGKASPATPRRIVPKGVVTRKSTDMLAVENPEVAKALRFIQANFSRTNLSVGIIVEAGKYLDASWKWHFGASLTEPF